MFALLNSIASFSNMMKYNMSHTRTIESDSYRLIWNSIHDYEIQSSWLTKLKYKWNATTWNGFHCMKILCNQNIKDKNSYNFFVKMLQILNAIKSLIKIERTHIDNVVFSLYHELTVIILIAFALFVTTNIYIGDPIDCMVQEIPKNVIDTYCWIYGTYLVSNKIQAHISDDVIEPGVAILLKMKIMK